MKEVYILGAGASNDFAKLPLGKDLVWKYFKNCKKMTPEKNGKPDFSEQDIEFQNYNKFLYEMGELFPIFADEAEKFRSRNIFYSPPTNISKEYYVDEILRVVQESKNNDLTHLLRMLMFEHLTGLSIDSRK